MIPYGRQDISQQDIDQVINVLKSDFLTQGPKVPLFEDKISTLVNSKYSCALNSATSALHVACLALEVTKGDYVWTSPISFVASSNCALYCGASVDFVDIDIATGNMSVEALEKKLINAEKNNILPKVLIPVHFTGQSCDMEKIYHLGLKYNFKIIEDASHAIGASYKGSLVGCCQFSDITIFSFHPVKIITTAEGGLATTNNEKLHTKMSLFRSHGVTRDKNLMVGDFDEDEPWQYQQLTLGYNYRLTELGAALGISQLDRLSSFIIRRNTLAAQYNVLLKKVNCEQLSLISDSYSSFHLYVVKVPAKVRKHVFNQLRKHHVGTNVHYIPIHLQPYYQSLGFKLGDFPVAEKFYDEIITLPLHPTLSDEQQIFVVDELNKSLLSQ
jgi:UDP-4-amino-4,6-dideoxy-N-acetyl-beta-L-altrosamine transaminase